MADLLTTLKSLFTKGIHVGLDIGAYSVKICVIANPQSQSPKVLAVGQYNMLRNSLSDGIISDERGILGVVEHCIGKLNYKVKDSICCMGMRGSQVVHKRVNLPFQSEEELEAQILEEAKQQIASPDIDDWRIDYQVLTDPDQEGQIAVMLVAARRDNIRAYLRIGQYLGLRPDIIDCDVFAIENAHEVWSGKTDENILLLDVGHDSTKLNFIQSGVSLVVRDLQVSGSILTQSIASGLGLGYEEAEALKHTLVENPAQLQADQELMSIVADFCEEMVEEINRTLEFFFADENQKTYQVDKVILSGGACVIPGLDRILASKIQTDVQTAKPFQNLNVTSNVTDEELARQHIYHVAVGLALRYQGDKPT